MSTDIKTTLKTMGFCGPCTASDTAEIDARDGRILAHAPVQLRGASEPRRAEPVVHQGPRQGIQGEGEDRALSVRPRLQGAGVFAQPHPASHEAGGLGPGGRSQPGQPRQEQVRAHQLGRGHRHHREGGAAHQGGVRPELDPRASRTATISSRPSTARAAPRATCSTRWPWKRRAWSWSTTSGCTRTSRAPCRPGASKAAATPCRPAIPIPGRAGTGAPSTSGASDPVGEGDISTTCSWTSANNSDSVLFWGCDVETTPWGWGGLAAPAATASSSPTSA